LWSCDLFHSLHWLQFWGVFVQDHLADWSPSPVPGPRALGPSLGSARVRALCARFIFSAAETVSLIHARRCFILACPKMGYTAQMAQFLRRW
jgi:hypothetical protein